MGSAGALYFISNDVYNEAKANYPTTLNEKGQEVFPEGVQFSEIVCEGSDIADATAGTIQEQTTGINKNVVDVEFSPSGANKFADAQHMHIIIIMNLFILYMIISLFHHRMYKVLLLTVSVR